MTSAVVARQRILVIDAYVPMPDRNSGGRRLFEILKLLRADGHDVTFMAQNSLDDSARYAEVLNGTGVKTQLAPAGYQVSVEGFEDGFRNQQFDAVIIAFYPVAMMYMPSCRRLFPNAKIIIDTVDLHFVREERQAQLHNDPEMRTRAQQTRRDELGVYAQADALWAITPVEQELLRREVPGITEIEVVPNIHEVEPDNTPVAQRSGLLFVGNFWHPPNAEGLGWFCQSVLPLIRQQLPDVKTTVVGANAPDFFKQFSNAGVALAGFVPDLHALLGSSRLSIAPLLHGAGMKGKVGEALAAGLPVVTTSIGSEGMGLVNGDNVLVADDPVAFAEAVVKAYNDESLWSALAKNGVAHMEANYTPAGIAHVVRAAVSPTSIYFGIPDWNDSATVKHVVDGYIRSASATSCLILGVTIDIQQAADLLTAWIGELGYDIEAIPDIELRAVSDGDLQKLDPKMIWVPMSGEKPSQLHSVESFR